MEKEYLDLTDPQQSIWIIEQYYPNTSINNKNISNELYPSYSQYVISNKEYKESEKYLKPDFGRKKWKYALKPVDITRF